MIKKLFILVFVAILLTSMVPEFPFYRSVYALTAVEEAEMKREQDLVKELSLQIFDKTDDPNDNIKFIDPSKTGVEITIDDKVYKDAKSPFLLPNLAIGEHKVIFKFKNKEGLVRVLAKYIYIVPKPPLFSKTLKSEVKKPDPIMLSGTALPNSEVLLIVNSKVKLITKVDAKGDWEYLYSKPEEGVNNIMAFTIKNGIISKDAETFKVEYIYFEKNENKKEVEEKPSFINQVRESLGNLKQKYPVVYSWTPYVVTTLLLVFIFLNVYSIIRKKKEKRTLSDIIREKSSTTTILDIINDSSELKKGKAKIVSVEKEPDLKKGNSVLSSSEETETKQSIRSKSKKEIKGNKQASVTTEVKAKKKFKISVPKITIKLPKVSKKKKTLSKAEFLKHFGSESKAKKS